MLVGAFPDISTESTLIPYNFYINPVKATENIRKGSLSVAKFRIDDLSFFVYDRKGYPFSRVQK